EDFRRVYVDELGAIEVLPSSQVLNRYLEGFTKQVDDAIVRARKFQIVADYAIGSTNQLLPQIFSQLGCDVIDLNPGVDEKRLAHTLDEITDDLQRLDTITGTLNTDMGVRIDTSGERISVVDDKGRILDGTKILV